MYLRRIRQALTVQLRPLTVGCHAAGKLSLMRARGTSGAFQRTGVRHRGGARKPGCAPTRALQEWRCGNGSTGTPTSSAHVA
jgi:hypothetical protein